MKGLMRSLLCLLLLWHGLFLMAQGIGIPSIVDTAQAMVANASVLTYHLAISALRLLVALTLAFGLGSLLGFLMAKKPLVDAVFAPLLYLLTPIPKVAFLPVVMVVLGISDLARIVVLVLVVIFQFVVAARDVLKAMPDSMIIAVDSLKLSRKAYCIDILLPYASGQLFTALRQGFGMSIAVLFFVETFVNQVGMGYFIMNRWGMVNYPEMFAGIVVLSLFGFAVYRGLDSLERRLCPWRFSKRS